ncbi:MAG: hypothetical protein Q4D98_09080 [Planctomycetia bacterium]|nr:hypothetical protein [Planctomycetia bacterium]
MNPARCFFILWTLFGFVVGISGTYGEETPSEGSVPWVFIPVDENGRPTGGEYYMPFDMFRNLNRRQAATTGQEAGWVYHSAVYSGSLVYTLSPRDWLVESMKATYSLDVLKPNTKIVLPLSPDEAYLSPGSVKLNGVTRKVDWENNRLVLVVAEPGRCSLEFSFLPVLMNPGEGGSQRETSGGLISGFRLAIPAIPNARLELRAPAVFSDISFPSAIGSREYDSVSRSWMVQLGPTRELAVRWKTPYSHPSSDTISAEELYNWILEKERLTVQCRYRFLCPESGSERLEWRTDSRLTLNPSSVRVSMLQNPSTHTEGEAASASGIAQRPEITFVEEGNERVLRMTFDTAVRGRLLVAFDLEGEGMETLGSVPFPKVRSVGSKLTRRWISVCPDVSLQTRLDDPQPAAVAVPEFLSLWEDFNPEKTDFGAVSQRSSVCVADETPTASAPLAPLWTLNVRPIPELCSFQESLTCLCGIDALTVRYQLQPPSAAVIPPVLHLEIPDTLRVENVLLQEGFQQKNLRFTRIDKKHLAIFTEPTKEVRETPAASRVVLTGAIPLPYRVTAKKPRTVHVTGIRLLGENVRTTARLVEIYRTDGVLAEFTPNTPAGEEPATPTSETSFVTESSASPFGTARLVTSFSPASREPISGKLTLSLNRHVLDAQTRTLLSPLPPEEKTTEEPTPTPESDPWNVRMEMRLEVREGVADMFRLELPGNLKGPFVLDPPYPYTLETIPAEDVAVTEEETSEETGTALKKNVPERVRMVVRPLRSLTGTSFLTLTCELTGAPETLSETGVLAELPVFRFPDFETVEQEVMLPVPADDKTRWTTEGMLSLERSRWTFPSDETPTAISDGTRYQVFQVVDKRFEARLQMTSSLFLQPQSVWSSHSLFWNTGNSMLGLTTLDIDPRMSRTCVVEMDKTLGPLEFRLDSQAAQVEEFTPEPSPETNTATRRYFRVSLRSVNLVQRLEILYRGETDTLLSPTMPRLKTEKSFHIRLPHLFRNGETGEKNGQRGTCILYVTGTDPVRLSQENGKPLAVRPMARIELVRMEQVVRLARTLAGFRTVSDEKVEIADAASIEMPDLPTVNETENWFRLWSPLWNAMRTRIHRQFDGDRATEYRDYQKELAAIEKEGEKLFTHRDKSASGPSLQTVFYHNVPEARIARTLAFDTSGDSGFLLSETILPASNRPRFLYPAIVVLLVTIGTLLVFFAFPWLLETTRTSPFWLLYAGILWLLCLSTQWVGILLCLSAGILVGIRFHQKAAER